MPLDIFIATVNNCIGWMKAQHITVGDFTFTFWEMFTLAVILAVGGYVVNRVIDLED